MNATGIGRVRPICAADFTAGSRRLIYECTGRAGPAWLKRERERYENTTVRYLYPNICIRYVHEAGRLIHFNQGIQMYTNIHCNDVFHGIISICDLFL